MPECAKISNKVKMYMQRFPNVWEYLINIRRYSYCDALYSCGILSRCVDSGLSYRQIIDTDYYKLIDSLGWKPTKHYVRFTRMAQDSAQYLIDNKMEA